LHLESARNHENRFQVIQWDYEFILIKTSLSPLENQAFHRGTLGWRFTEILHRF